ncbi:MAG TPA: hypothetical protein VKW06_05060 [Candidatus Angelobacter sp.]|nr:hypothetical protein [Candidatus Angelobacter sp.]
MKYGTWLNLLHMKPARASAITNKRGAPIRCLVRALLCSALTALPAAGQIPTAEQTPTPVQTPTGVQTPIEVLHVPELEAGFHFLYQLKPAEAHAQFQTWQKVHPQDPLGSASEAAAYLFEECYRQGVLTSAFFLDNKRFLGKVALKPDPELRAAFFAAVKKAQDLAQQRLTTAPEDTNALFSMTLSLGMQADYASLIDKHQVDSLKMIGDADKYAKRLLAAAPAGTDAYLTLGTANYIIGSLPGIKKFFLGFAGIHGDKKLGIQQLEMAAASGHYLRPFAKIMLALAALREKKPEVARVQLSELVEEFPENPLFADELAKLNVPPCRGRSVSMVKFPQSGQDASAATVTWTCFLEFCRFSEGASASRTHERKPRDIQLVRACKRSSLRIMSWIASTVTFITAIWCH